MVLSEPALNFSHIEHIRDNLINLVLLACWRIDVHFQSRQTRQARL